MSSPSVRGIAASRRPGKWRSLQTSMTTLIIYLLIPTSICADAATTEQLLKAVAANREGAGVVDELGRRKDPRILPLLRQAAEGTLQFHNPPPTVYAKEHGSDGGMHYLTIGNGIRLAAKKAAARQGDKKYFEEFVVGLSSDDFAYKDYCINAMLYIGDRAAIRSLMPVLDDERQIYPTNDVMANTFGDKAIGVIRALMPANEVPAPLKQPVWLTAPARDALKSWWQHGRKKFGEIPFGRENIYASGNRPLRH